MMNNVFIWGSKSFTLLVNDLINKHLYDNKIQKKFNLLK